MMAPRPALSPTRAAVQVSSHGGYHPTARESCRRGYAEAAFILDFCCPDAGVCRKLSFWGGLPDRESLHQGSPGCAHSHTTARPQTAPPVQVSIWFVPSMGYQLDCPASTAIRREAPLCPA